MNWSQKDIDNLVTKGLKVDGIKSIEIKTKKPKQKIVKISTEKLAINLLLQEFVGRGLISGFETEHQFHQDRKFRFDWAIPSLKIGIEYEGIYSKKSRHTTVSGYSNDIEKYNLALVDGWKVLRYTANNYQNLSKDLEQLITNS